MGLLNRIPKLWSIFKKEETVSESRFNIYEGRSYYRPDRTIISSGNERSIITSALTRIANDVASIPIEHVRLDSDGRYIETIDSSLNRCLTLNANIDQTGREFIYDVVMSLCDEGSVAIVISRADVDPNSTDSYKIEELRVGKILEWSPANVKVRVYNEDTGQKEDIWFPKKCTAILENPMYAIMNEQNSTFKRLVNKLNILDAIDKQSGSGKLDLILQLPYVVRSDRSREIAENRRKDIETQLSNSRYGIAYTDGTEHVIQLNRPVENNLMGQIEYLTKLFFNQLGMSEAVFDGTADEKEIILYQNRIIEPFLSTITNALRWKFLTDTARSQGQDIKFFIDPFKLVPAAQISEIADKFTRNEILSPNEIRSIIGRKPSKDPKADELRNRNITQSKQELSNDNSNNSESSSDGNITNIADFLSNLKL